MRPEEIAALGDLASEAAAGAARQIHEVHLGIAGRVWRRVGPAALPVKLAHDRIAGGACVGKVRHVFTLGTPHRGAPLEQAANACLLYTSDAADE